MQIFDDQEMNMEVKYLAVGHITIDEIWEGNKRKEMRIGGSVAYGSIFASGLGYKAGVITRVGRDLPKEFLDKLKSAGIDLRLKVSDCQTTKFIVKKEKEHEIVSLSSLCDPIQPEDLELKADIIHLGPVASEIDENIIARSLSMGNTVLLDLQGILRSFDSEGRIKLRAEKLSKIAGLDIVVHANEEEAKAATGEDDPLKAVEKLSDMFWLASVTLGMKGAMVASSEGLVIAGPPHVEGVDSVGAGDVFTAALGIALDRGDTFEDASRYAVAASAASTLYKGPSMVPEDEIRRLVKGVSVTWL